LESLKFSRKSRQSSKLFTKAFIRAFTPFYDFLKSFSRELLGSFQEYKYEIFNKKSNRKLHPITTQITHKND
jgi:hypothetical protein